jgi:hypothetical protein
MGSDLKSRAEAALANTLDHSTDNRVNGARRRLKVWLREASTTDSFVVVGITSDIKWLEEYVRAAALTQNMRMVTP